jgi:hypothetical protein
MNNWLLVTVALCSIPPSALADDILKFREVAHQVSVQSWQVGDIDGHAIFPGHASGIASFPDGVLGTISLIAMPIM